MYTSPEVERLTGLRFETAGENLQNDAVQILRPRGDVFNVHSPDGWNRDIRGRCVDNGHAMGGAPDGGMRAVRGRTLK